MYPAPIVSKHTFSPGRRRRDTSKCSELSVKDAPICSWLEKFMDLLELQPASPHPFFGMAAKCLFVRGATELSDQGLGHWRNQTDATCLFSLLLAFWITEFQSEMSGGDPEKLPQTQLLTNLYLVNLLCWRCFAGRSVSALLSWHSSWGRGGWLMAWWHWCHYGTRLASRGTQVPGKSFLRGLWNPRSTMAISWKHPSYKMGLKSGLSSEEKSIWVKCHCWIAGGAEWASLSH